MGAPLAYDFGLRKGQPEGLSNANDTRLLQYPVSKKTMLLGMMSGARTKNVAAKTANAGPANLLVYPTGFFPGI